MKVNAGPELTDIRVPEGGRAVYFGSRPEPQDPEDVIIKTVLYGVYRITVLPKYTIRPPRLLF